MVLKLSLYTSQSSWWYSEYPYTHHPLLGGTQTIPILITDTLSWYSNYLFTHHSLPGGTQTIPLLITVCLMVLRLPLSQHSLRGGPKTIPIHITVSFLVLRLSLYSSQSLWWHSDYPNTHHNLPGGSDNPYTHHRLPGGIQTIPLLITVSQVLV